MRNFSKKIITSVLTLVLTVVALGTGVFAWFSMNTKTTATGLKGSAEAAEGGFYISLNGQTWVNTIDLGTELQNNGFIGQANYEFTDLTSANGIDIRKIEIAAGNALKGSNATEGYIEFDLYFLTGSVVKKVKITELKITTTTSTNWTAEKGASAPNRSISIGDVMEAELGHALRVSFQERAWNVHDAGDNPATDGIAAIVFENTASADAFGATKVFGNTTGFATVATNFAAQYYNAINNGGLDSLVPVSNRADLVIGAGGVVSEELLETRLIDAGSIATVRGSLDNTFTHGGRVTVRVWLEGWDQEAFNALFTGQATIDMTFEIEE